jgi:osmoprotectant transport system substrate-binding protein
VRWLVGLLCVVVVGAGCGGSSKSGGTSVEPAAGERIDSQLVFGGPPECTERDLCLGEKSQQVYGFEFKAVRKLDTGGPATTKALQDNTIQVAELFTGSSAIDPDFVMLNDDRQLQPAENPIALVREPVLTPDVEAIINSVSAKLDLAAYNEMATAIELDKKSPEAVAKSFLAANGLDRPGTSGQGVKLRIAAANLAGARAISQAYAQALEARGYAVTFRDNVGTREDLYPMLRNGDIDMYGEFTGSLLTYLKGNPTGDSNETYASLRDKLSGTGLIATTPAPAQDGNAFYVTQETADKFKLVNMSDLLNKS